MYRHDIAQHGYIFCDIDAITQLAIEIGKPLFDAEYEDWFYLVALE